MQTQSQSNQNKINQMKSIQLVKSNSEFFTVVRGSIDLNANRNLKISTDYIEKNTQVRIDYENFIQSFIQVAYLIYTSKFYGLSPQIRPEDVRIQENYNWGVEKRFSIIIFFRFITSERENSTYSKIIKDIYLFLQSNHEQYEKKIQQKAIDDVYKNQIKTFLQQVKFICEKLDMLDQIQREKQFYIHLQQTDLFREHSMLLKIKNASILDYIRLKISNFKINKEKDVCYVNEYNNQKKKSKCDLQQLKKKQKLIQRNIIQFFQQIQLKNPKRFTIKIESDHHNYKTKFIFTVYQTPSEPFHKRIERIGKDQGNQTMQIQQNSNSNNMQTGNKDRVPYSEYQIEYNSQKNSICVKLILSSIVFSSENSDYILFQSNVLSFQSANINLQFVEEKSSDKNVNSGKRYLAFRGSSCFNSKEPTLQKILILMDLTMIAAKVYEPQLLSMRKNFMIDKDPRKLSTIYQKINHYTKVFLRCAKKVYNQ